MPPECLSATLTCNVPKSGGMVPSKEKYEATQGQYEIRASYGKAAPGGDRGKG